jgi:hypothetical protein
LDISLENRVRKTSVGRVRMSPCLDAHPPADGHSTRWSALADGIADNHSDRWSAAPSYGWDADGRSSRWTKRLTSG